MKVIIPVLLFLSALLPVFGQDTITLSGYVRTPCGTPVPGVEVRGAFTDANGFYSVDLPAGGDYTVWPTLNGGWLDGVDQNDLALLAQHISGQQPLGSPYFMIAADVNNSNAISTLDAILLRQLLDGTITSIPGNTSWRFLPADYQFPASLNPWFEALPEIVNINNVPGDTTFTADIAMDFIAIKVGDLDCSAAPWPGPVGQLNGKLLRDENGDCQLQGGEEGLGNWIVTAASPDGAYYASTTTDGQYHLTLPVGDYQVSTVPPNPLWAPCAPVLPVSITEDTTIARDFAVQAAADCPFMEVDISPLSLRRCAANTYQVRYCNSGTALAAGAYTEVTFDDHQAVLGSSLPWSSASGETYTFPLGDIPPGECGSFSIQTELSCDALPGQAHCVEAHIFPDSLCPAPPGPFFQMEAACAGDSVHFRIDNRGGNMPAERHFIVIEDDLVMVTGQFQLKRDETFELSLPANGATLRLLLDPLSAPGGYAPPTLAVEACGPTGPDGPSLGFVNQYANESGNPFIDIDCRENTGPYDPNDKQAFPRGQGPNRYLHPTSGLEYLIRFQNTGTDTAFLVVIRDTLPPELNPATLRPGAASHPYTYTLRAGGVAEFRFDNIMLPDSNVNLTGSKGFVQFHIEQQPGNPNGALIENSAAIYFDYNEPIITNYAWHTADDGFLLPGQASITVLLRNERGQSLGGDPRVFLIQEQDTVATATGGEYRFDGLPTGQSYTVAPYRNDGFLNGGYLNGISTFDIVLLSKHILGVQPLGSPYLMLAADINYSGSITALDMVALRRIILQIDTVPPFPDDQPSWRFVRADYEFPDPNNPWLEPIPSTAVFDPLLYDEAVEFIGIKLGGLNGDATAGQMNAAPRRYLPLLAKPKQEEGVFTLEVSPAQSGDWIAFQAELQLPPGAVLRAVHPGTQAGELAYALTEGNRLRLCWWHTEAVRFEQGAPLFTLELAPEGAPTDELSLDITPGFSRAYTIEGAPFTLAIANSAQQPGLSVYPNPGSGPFVLSGHTGAREVQVKVYNLTGHAVYEVSVQGGGRWVHRLPEEALPAGVFVVEVSAGGRRWVERLVVE